MATACNVCITYLNAMIVVNCGVIATNCRVSDALRHLASVSEAVLF